MHHRPGQPANIQLRSFSHFDLAEALLRRVPGVRVVLDGRSVEVACECHSSVCTFRWSHERRRWLGDSSSWHGVQLVRSGAVDIHDTDAAVAFVIDRFNEHVQEAA